MRNQILLLLMSGHQLGHPSEGKELLYDLPKLKPFRGKFLLSSLVADFLPIKKEKFENHCPSCNVNWNVIKDWRTPKYLTLSGFPFTYQCPKAQEVRWRAGRFWMGEIET